MKTNIYKYIRLSILLAFLLCGNAFAQAATPETAAKNFYKWYIGSLNAENYPKEKQKPKMLKAVSKRLGKWLYSKAYEEYGADYFLDAQDWNSSWEKNIKSSKAVVKGNTATLKITLTSPPDSEGWSGDHVLALKLVKEGGAWKIDTVAGNNN